MFMNSQGDGLHKAAITAAIVGPFFWVNSFDCVDDFKAKVDGMDEEEWARNLGESYSLHLGEYFNLQYLKYLELLPSVSCMACGISLNQWLAWPFEICRPPSILAPFAEVASQRIQVISLDKLACRSLSPISDIFSHTQNEKAKSGNDYACMQ